LTDSLVAALARLEPLSLVAVLCLMPLAIYAKATPFLVLLAGLGSAAVVGAAVSRPWWPAERSATRTTFGVFVLVGVSLVLTVLAASYLATLFAPQFAVPALMAAVAALVVWYVVFRTDSSTPHRWIATLVMLVALLTTSYAFIVDIAETNLDVFVLHRTAAEALVNGENPYVKAQALDASPLAPDGALVEGYTYPPTAMVAYSVSQWMTGDPRWAGVVAIGVVVLLIASPWAAWTGPVAKVRLSLALPLVTAPGFGIIAFFSWTEPLSLPFLLVAGRFWRSKPIVSAVALGLALSTKQYFILALPLLLFWPDEWRWKRIGIAGAVALATMLPFLLIDAGALVDALFGNTAFSALPRPDSTNLVHFGLVTSRWVATGAAAGLGVWLGRRGGDGFHFTLALAAVLSVAFFLGVAAFRNYWFLIAGMVLIALAQRYIPAKVPERPPVTAGAGTEPSVG
jgi:hypothetical protein